MEMCRERRLAIAEVSDRVQEQRRQSFGRGVDAAGFQRRPRDVRPVVPLPIERDGAHQAAPGVARCVGVAMANAEPSEETCLILPPSFRYIRHQG